MFLEISWHSSPLNLLVFRSRQAKIIVVKRLIQGRNYVTKVRVEPKACDQGRRKNDAYSVGCTTTDREQRRLAEKGDPKYILIISRAILPKPSLCDEITATKSM